MHSHYIAQTLLADRSSTPGSQPSESRILTDTPLIHSCPAYRVVGSQISIVLGTKRQVW